MGADRKSTDSLPSTLVQDRPGGVTGPPRTPQGDEACLDHRRMAPCFPVLPVLRREPPPGL